jgi:hypothetical protein
VWAGTSIVLFGAGLLLARTSPYSAVAVWSWREAGLLLLALVPCVFLGVPGALVALRHPWAAGLWRQEQRFNHPQVFGLTLAWAGILLSGWLSATVLLVPPVPFMYVADVVVLLAAFGPAYAILVFDRRR